MGRSVKNAITHWTDLPIHELTGPIFHHPGSHATTHHPAARMPIWQDKIFAHATHLAVMRPILITGRRLGNLLRRLLRRFGAYPGSQWIQGG